MKKFLFFVPFLFAASLQSAAPVEVKPSEILYLSRFDSTVKPEVGNGEKLETNTNVTTGSRGFPFKGSSRQEALDVVGLRKFLLIPAEGNYDHRQGTLQMWVQPHWNLKSYAHCVFFHVIPKAEKRRSFNYNVMYVQKNPRTQTLSLSPRGKKFEFPFEGGKDKWFHISVTWDLKSRSRCFYVNGKLMEKSRYLSRITPEYIGISVPSGHNAQALIDELRILNRPLTEAEVKQDYDAQMAGIPFTVPHRKKPEDAFKLVPDYNEAKTDAGVIYENVDFNARRIANDFKVDGDLSKKVWQQAEVLPQMFTRRGEKIQRSDIKLLYSGTSLYIGASFYQDMKQMYARYDQNDQNVFNDDCVEILLDVPGKEIAFYHFAINPIGARFDTFNKDRKYDARNIRIKTRRLADRWDMEVQLPFADLGMTPPFTGEFIGARFCRRIVNPELVHGAVPKMKSGGNFQRAYLAKVNFVAGDTGAAALSSSKNTFSAGMNTLSLTVERKSEAKFNGELRIISEKRCGTRNFYLKREVSIPGNGKVNLSLPVKIDDLDIVKVFAVLYEGKNECASLMLTPDFPQLSVPLKDFERSLNVMSGGVAALSSIDHPIYQAAGNTVNEMRRRCDDFKAELEKACAGKRIVPAEKVKEFFAYINGFNKICNENRFLVWETSPWEIGSPNAMPPENYRRIKNLEFRQAGNEREAICLIFSGLLCGNRLDLRIVPRSVNNRKDPFISTDKFEVFTEPFINHNGQIITAPLVQSPGNAITITPGQAVRVWIVFNSRGVPSGDYRTQIALKPAYDYSIPDQEIPVKLKIWDFTLPETHEWPLPSFMWGPNFHDNDEVAMLKLTHDFHVTHGWSKGFIYSHGIAGDHSRQRLPEGVNFRKDLVLTANQEFLETVKKLNMKFVMGWNLPSDPEFYHLLSERLIKMGLRPDQFIFKALIADEFVKSQIPRRAKDREALADFAKKHIFQAAYLSTPPPVGATMDDIEAAKLPEFFKMWTVINGLLNDKKLGPDVIRRLRAKGCEVWSYKCTIYMQTLPVLGYFRFYPWKCFMMGLDGMALYTVTSPRGDDGFDHRDGYDEGLAVRGINKTPIPTKRFQALREGLEDVAYMDILAKELTRVEKNGKKFPEYRELLDSRNKVIESDSQQMVDQWRNAVGEAIHVLKNTK